MLSAAICHGARTFLSEIVRNRSDHSKLSKSKRYFNRFLGFMQRGISKKHAILRQFRRFLLAVHVSTARSETSHFLRFNCFSKIFLSEKFFILRSFGFFGSACAGIRPIISLSRMRVFSFFANVSTFLNTFSGGVFL